MIVRSAGGVSGSNISHNEIFKLERKTHKWILVGRMKKHRYNHGVSEINFSDIAGYCREDEKETISEKSVERSRH